jgi:signal transduction histidine kinase
MTKRVDRMLVVDDEEAVRNLCTRTLEGMGFSVESAANAEEAWRLLNARDFDCVLTDISMPGPMDGTALTEEVRGRFPETDILIMTGDPNLRTAVATLKHGARDYLVKPFEPMALEAAVERCFERRRLSGELDKEKLLRQELAAAYAELQKTERSKDAFIAILSHELRTPLTIAIAAAELLEDVSDPSRTREVVERLRSSLARENEVIGDLLLFSRLSAGDPHVEFLEVPLAQMLRSLVDNYRSLWEEKRLSMELVFDEAPALLRGDPALLQTAFKHLLLNAIRFNTKGGRVRIETRNRPDALEVIFSDTGEGIAPEQKDRIFDRFYQVAEHMTRRLGGLGLGLSIVRRIIEAHGGRIDVASPKGGGSEFRVSLPREKHQASP